MTATILLRILPMWAGFALGTGLVYALTLHFNWVLLSGLCIGQLCGALVEFKIPRP